MVITMTAGTGLIMWMGELITERGIGNGMSLLIFTSIAAAFPALARGRSGSRAASRSSSSCSRSASSSWRSSCSSSSRSGASRCSTPSAWSVGAPTAATTPTSRSRSTWPASCPSSSPRRCCTCPRSSRSSTSRQPGETPPAVGRVDPRQYLTTGDHPLYMLALLPAHRRLHVLLRRDHLQPGRGRRQHEEVRRLHPRHPCRSPDRRVPRLRADPHHAARLALPRSHRAASRSSRWRSVGANQNFPFGGASHPDHRRCRARDRQADRRAAAAAPLRRAPADDGRPLLLDRRTAGLRQGHAGRAHRRGLRHPGHLDRRHLPRATSRTAPSSASRSRRSSRPATSCPTSSPASSCATGSTQADAARGFLLDGYPRNLGQVADLDAFLDGARRGARRRDRARRSARREHRPPDASAPPSRVAPTTPKRSIANRLAIYERETAPILDVYRERGIVARDRRRRHARRGHRAHHRGARGPRADRAARRLSGVRLLRRSAGRSTSRPPSCGRWSSPASSRPPRSTRCAR